MKDGVTEIVGSINLCIYTYVWIWESSAGLTTSLPLVYKVERNNAKSKYAFPNHYLYVFFILSITPQWMVQWNIDACWSIHISLHTTYSPCEISVVSTWISCATCSRAVAVSCYIDRVVTQHYLKCLVCRVTMAPFWYKDRFSRYRNSHV